MTDSQRKWTPGPWRWENGQLFGPESHVVLGEANDALIAAAPELYEALQRMASYFYARPLGDFPVDRFDAAEAALAKARGETTDDA